VRKDTKNISVFLPQVIKGVFASENEALFIIFLCHGGWGWGIELVSIFACNYSGEFIFFAEKMIHGKYIRI
jgi:hypothetical protein